MARQCTQPKRPKKAVWFKDKVMLVEAQESSQILDEKQLAFLVDPSILDGQASQKTIPNNATFQTGDLDAYDSDCDDVSTTQAILMASLSNYSSDVISEKAQRIKPTLYDGSVISSQHVVIPMIDDEETLILEKELRVYVRDTCPNANKPSEKLVAITPINKVKKVRFFESLTSSSNIHKQVESSKTPDSNTPVLHSTGLKSSTNARRSQPTGNKKNDGILQTPSSNMKK
nr:hypothetical protein [Tanacetum cinerariifolium]